MQRKFNLLRFYSFFLVLVVLIAMTGCNKAPVYTPPSYKSAVVYDFWLEKTTSNPSINRPYQGMIMWDTAIRLMVDYGTDITALEPTIFADVDSIFPTGKQNFSNPVRYTLWAKGESRTYTVRITASPVQFPVFKAIAAGYTHVLALKSDGTVWVCGDNLSGQLGLGDYSSRNRLTQVPIYDADQIFTGDAASIIKLKDGTAWGTGNQFGQLGLGHKNAIVTFTRIPFVDDAVQVAVTFGEVFIIKPDGTVWGAGRNWTKILAQGDDELRASFVKIPINNVKQLNGTASEIIVQKTNGEVWGWGNNTNGALGVGDKMKRDIPVLLPTPSAGVDKIFTSGTTTFLIDNNGQIWATGANINGQLATGDLMNRSSFTQITFFDDKSIDVIIPRLLTTGFKDRNGNMWNVGDNSRGLIAVGNISNQPFTTPVQLSGFTTTAIAGTGHTAFALKTDGTLWAWGSNSSGVLGTETDITAIPSPIQIK